MGPFRDGWTEADVEAAIARGDTDELRHAPIVVSMDPPDCEWSEGICVRLSSHPDPWVRGNAILGFGHLARTCRRLTERVVRPIIQGGLRDPDPVVRGQAVNAADDTTFFLGWAGFDAFLPGPGE